MSDDRLPWIDTEDPIALHLVMRANYAGAQAMLARRPALRKAHEGCQICARIVAEQAGAAPAGVAPTRKRLVIDQALMRRLLHLPAGVEIVHMYADNQPNVVSVITYGAHPPAADPDDAAPDED